MFLHRLRAASVALLVLGVTGAPAHALPDCVRNAQVQNAEEGTNKTEPVFKGLTASGDLMEVRSTGDGSWTIVLTLKDGASCAVIGGGFWEIVVSNPNLLDDRNPSP